MKGLCVPKSDITFRITALPYPCPAVSLFVARPGTQVHGPRHRYCRQDSVPLTSHRCIFRRVSDGSIVPLFENRMLKLMRSFSTLEGSADASLPHPLLTIEGHSRGCCGTWTSSPDMRRRVLAFCLPFFFFRFFAAYSRPYNSSQKASF